MGTAMRAKDKEFAVTLAVQYVAYLRPSELCSLTAGQVIQPLRGSGTLSCALRLAPREDLKASKTAEFDERILLDGELWRSIKRPRNTQQASRLRHHLGAFHRQSMLKISRNGRGVRSERDLSDGNSKTRQVAQREKRQTVREACWVAERDLGAASVARVYGQLVTDRMSLILEGSLPRRPPA